MKSFERFFQRLRRSVSTTCRSKHPKTKNHRKFYLHPRFERLEDRLDFREVANPAGVRIEITAQVNRHLERVTVQASAFVAFRDVGQAVGGFEGKFFEDFHSGLSSVRWLSPAAMKAGDEFNSLGLSMRENTD